jgi:energy-coupling factor transporter ATP-binding protein EcfA2
MSMPSVGQTAPFPARHPPIEGFDLVSYLIEFLGTPQPKFFMITGPVGSGKSTLLRALVPLLPGPKVFLGYQMPPGLSADGSAPAGSHPLISLLLVDAQVDDRTGPRSSSAIPSVLADFSPQGPEPQMTLPAPLAHATEGLVASGGGTIIADSWDRGSEAFFRKQAKRPEAVQTFTAQASALFAAQSVIPSTPTNLIICVSPEWGRSMHSLSDGIVDLREEGHAGGRVRVCTVAKVRGAPPATPAHLYTLEGGHFRPLSGLSPGFVTPVARPEVDPDPGSESIWPGSTPFARAFGRLRFGGSTLISRSSDCPNTVPSILAMPIAMHTLLTGGRVVWIPPSSVRAARLIGLIGRYVPAEMIRERLRILSASAPDSDLGEFGGVLLPLREEGTSEHDVGIPNDPRVRPMFPSRYRFLRDRSDSTPAVQIVSPDGLRAAAASIGVTLDPSNIPIVIESFTRLPYFHMVGYGDIDDPVLAYMRPAADALIEIEMIYGRPVVFGIRPQTAPFILDWNQPEGRYSLVPVA